MFVENESRRTWEQAYSICRKSSGNRAALASITSSAENNFIVSLLNYKDGLEAWIGGTYLRTNRWAWIDGSSWTGYTNWNRGEPSNFGGNAGWNFVLSGGKNAE